MEKREDVKKRFPDKNYQIRLYTKVSAFCFSLILRRSIPFCHHPDSLCADDQVDRDYWAYMDLREWYNKTGVKGEVQHHGGDFIDGKPSHDSAGSAFIVNNPKDTDPSSLSNKSNYMLQCGGPHDPSGFLKTVKVDPGSKNVSEGTAQPSDAKHLANAETAMMRSQPHLEGIKKKPAKLETIHAPHWAHWQKNLNYSAAKLDNMMKNGEIPKPSQCPWAEGDVQAPDPED